MCCPYKLEQFIATLLFNAFYADSPILVVHYLGTEEEWNNVTICSGNEALLNAKIYCGDYKPTSASGTCGENLTWAFDADTFTLTISGTGAMDDFYTDYFIDLETLWIIYMKATVHGKLINTKFKKLLYLMA